MSFLRNVNCSQPGCLDLHDWGDERDCFTKEDLSALCVMHGPCITSLSECLIAHAGDTR